MAGSFSSILRLADKIVVKSSLSLAGPGQGLVVILLHGIFDQRNGRQATSSFPHEGYDADLLRQLIEYLLQLGYVFPLPAEVAAATCKAPQQALLTLDDGYYNNHRLLPVLKDLNVPAIIHIATGNVERNEAFWWDAGWRLLRAKGKSEVETHQFLASLKQMPSEEIKLLLIKEAGENAFKQFSDEDRPFTSAELHDFSREKGIYLGNHTADHTILTLSADPKAEIQLASSALQRITGLEPVSIAYPNGNYDERVIHAVQACKIPIGFTTVPGRNILPIRNPYEIRRNQPMAMFPVKMQVDQWRAKHSPYLWSKHRQS